MKIFGNVKIYTRNSLFRRISESFGVMRFSEKRRINPLLTPAYSSPLDRFDILINKIRKSG